MAEKKKMQLMPPKQRTPDDFVAAAGEVKSKPKGQGEIKFSLLGKLTIYERMSLNP